MSFVANSVTAGQGVKNPITRANALTPLYHPDQARFNHWFFHPWQGIEKIGQDGQWTTFHRKFYLSPDEIFSRWQDGDRIIGLRFGRETNYFVIDVDSYSAYHPDQSEGKFKAIAGALEEMGISAPVPITSSFSGGLHLLGFLPEKVNSFNLSLALTYALNGAGLQIKPGQLEIFPNVKQYSREQFTLFNGHRLPLQPGQGSFILDDDLTPVSADLARFLNLADNCADSVDLPRLMEAMEAARRSFSLSRYQRKEDGDRSNFYADRPMSNKAKEWRKDWEQRLSEGFTGFGQTNDLIKIAVAYGVIFLGLTGAELREKVKDTITNAPGYKIYCRHQREIDRRIRDWCKSTETNQHYLAYCNHPERLGGIKFKPKGPSNDDRRLDAMERISEAVAKLKADGTLPTKKTARLKAIAKLAKCSFSTLTKADYLPLWTADHDDVVEMPSIQDIASVSAIPPQKLHTPPMKCGHFGLPLESPPENKKIIMITQQPRLEKSFLESSICTSPGVFSTSETPETHTASEIQPLTVIKSVPNNFKPGDWVIEADRPHYLLRLESIDDGGEWCRCQDKRQRQRGLRGGVYLLTELLPAPIAIVEDAEINHPAPPLIAVKPDYYPGHICLHLGEIVKVTRVLGPNLAAISSGNGEVLATFSELTSINGGNDNEG